MYKQKSGCALTFYLLSAMVFSQEENFRLPKTLTPTKYELTIGPHFNNFTFTGTVKIYADVNEITQDIILHAKELNVTKPKVLEIYAGIPRPLTVDSFVFLPEKDFLLVHMERNLSVGMHISLEMFFCGVLSDNNFGFYKGNYTDMDGNLRWFATTQFSPLGARSAFPCFDEPGLKAPFKISVVRENAYNSISNEVLDYTVNMTHTDKIKIDHYRESKPMATYFVAFTISEFDYISSSTNDLDRVYSRPKVIKNKMSNYALHLSEIILNAIENFVGFNYTMGKKMYQLAIPDRWYFYKAMENWGLVSYRESSLLYKDGSTTAQEKQNIVTTISHEFGHQWFGNLVTPVWWSYVWLKEGFATYFEYYITSIVEPEMETQHQFVHVMQYAMDKDGDNETRPMTYEPSSPSEISDLLDVISYSKAGSIVRMLEHAIGSQVFKKGLNKYLLDRKFKSATEEDLWKNIQEAVEEEVVTLPDTIESIMKTWTNQAGYPLVTVYRNDDGTINITQNRFFKDKDSSSFEKWTIPINYATPEINFDNTQAYFWLKDLSFTIKGIHLHRDDWLVLNKQQTGYYRVNYDKNLWQNIIKVLNSSEKEKIHFLSRAQLIDDAFNLFRNDNINSTIFINLLQYLKNETNFFPLKTFLNTLDYINNFQKIDVNYNLFTNFAIDLLSKVYEYLGPIEMLSDTHLDKLIRGEVLDWMCKFNHKVAKEKILEEFLSGRDIAPNLQAAVYCNVMRMKNDTLSEFLIDLYTDDETEELEKIRIVKAMGCTTDEKYTKMLLNGEAPIRAQDKFVAFLSTLSENSSTTLNFLMNNYDELNIRFSKSELSKIIEEVSTKVNNEIDIQKMETFLKQIEKEHPKSVEKARINLKLSSNWIEKNVKEIREFVVLLYQENNFDESKGNIYTLSNILAFISYILLCCIYI